MELFIRHIDNRTDTSWITITIYEAPQPDLGADSTVCISDSVTFDAGFCAGCSYEWSNLTTSQTGIAFTQTFTTGDSGLYMVSVTNPNGCTGRDTVLLMIVSEVSVTVTPPFLSICSGDSAIISLQGNVSGCSFTWTAVCQSPFVTGYSNGSGPVINQLLHNADSIDHIVTYTIIPSYSSCSSIPLDYPVTVHPLPDVYFDPPALTVCSQQSALISLYSHVSGTGFSWTASGSSGNVTGYSDGSGSLIDHVLVNSGTATEYVTYHVTPTGLTGCEGTGTDYTVEVIPTVVTTVTPPSLSICSGDTTGISLQCNLPGCSFTWTAVASTPLVTGYSAGAGNSISQSLINSDTVDQTVTYSIVPSLAGCGADTTSYPVTIHPLLPVSVTISASLNPVCEGIPVTFTGAAVNGGSTPAYQWRVNANNAGINNAVFTYVPVDGDVVTCMLTSSEECTSGNPASSNPVTITTAEVPVVTFAPCFDTITTTNAKPVRLKGGIPLGGTYTGSGVVNGFFYPAIAGSGSHQITYSYTNTALCNATAHIFLYTSTSSLFTCGNNLTDIRDNQTYPTVQIGSQCWMASNLNYGTEIPYTTPQRDNCIPEKYTNPISGIGHPASVYQWEELMLYSDIEETQGLCPPNWHVPSETDWNTLFAHWTNNAFAGAPLKYSGYSGFNAFLTGAGFFNKSWYLVDFATFFWSSTAQGPEKAWAHGMNDYNYSVSYYPSYRANAFSVRCILD